MKYRNVLKFVSILTIGTFAVETPAISCPAQITQAEIAANNRLNNLTLGWNTKATNVQIGAHQYTVLASFAVAPGVQGNPPVLTLGANMAHNGLDNISCVQNAHCDCTRTWHHNGLWQVVANLRLSQE